VASGSWMAMNYSYVVSFIEVNIKVVNRFRIRTVPRTMGVVSLGSKQFAKGNYITNNVNDPKTIKNVKDC